jgi:prefoldin subunit 5
MDRNKIIEIIEDPSIKSNKDLNEGISFLSDEFEKTKDAIVQLTKHLDAVEDAYKKINEELGKRVIR